MKYSYLLKKPYRILLHWNAKGYFKNFSDATTVKLLHFGAFGKRLDLKNPQTFDEKLQWLKAYDHNPLYTGMADKYLAKEYIAEHAGEEYVIKTLGVWDTFDQIDFDTLPDKFVLKTTHDSGGICICTDKNTFDIEKAREKLQKRLKENYYLRNREWVYKDIKPRIIAEEYMEDAETKELRDYKFFCFNGKAHCLALITNRHSVTGEFGLDYFDREYNHLNLTSLCHPHAAVMPEKPRHFEEMVELADKLSVGFPHIRIDFYEANDKIYVGEFTFYPMAGYEQLDPPEWEKEWGDLIDLSLVKERKQ